MTTKAEFITDLEGRMSAAKTSGFWTAAQKLLAINQAGEQICTAKRWPFLELALTTTSRDGKEYYDYPPVPHEFTKNSIYQINIEDESYGAMDGRTRVDWGEFQRRKNGEDTDEYVFTNHNGFYFLYPIPEDGKEISLYGLKKWTELVNDADEAITPSELDDAIVKVALAKMFRKGKRYSEAKAEMMEVFEPQIGIIEMVWNKMNEESPAGYIGESQSSRW